MGNESVEKSILHDYKFAVMNIVWSVQFKDGKNFRKLIFMSIEFYPNECEDFFEYDERSTRAKKENVRLFHRRIKLTSEQALKLYINSDKEQAVRMIWDESVTDKDGSKKIIKLPVHEQMPDWPYFSISKQSEECLCPFVPASWGICRLHHKISAATDPFLTKLCQTDEIIQWLRMCLKWNIHEYPELIGSMHIILPNPIYRSLEWKLIPAEGDHSSEEVFGHIFFREDKNICTGLELWTIERSVVGYLNINKTIINTPDIFVRTVDRVKEYAYLVFSKEYGLLDYGGFFSFMRSMHFSISIKDKVRVVEIKEKKSVTKYDVSLDDNVSTSVVGNESSTSVAFEKLSYRKNKLFNQKQAKILEQHIFRRNDKLQAAEYIRSIFGKSKKRVIVVDPYFSTIDLYKFILSVSKAEVKIDIITSHNILKEKVGNDCRGMQLIAELQNLKNKQFNNILQIFVMTGKSPAIHDRFLIIDDIVYFSGNSLNHIGERTSMMLRVPNPEDVLNLVDEITNNKHECITLEEWGNRQGTIAQPLEDA